MNSGSKIIRLALVWDNHSQWAHRVLHGVLREANLHPDIMLKRFDINATKFTTSILPAIRQWAPDGIIAWNSEVDRMTLLRRQCPAPPIIATSSLPLACVDAVICADGEESTRTAAEHMRLQGAKTIALFCVAAPEVRSLALSVFHTAEPDSPAFSIHLSDKATHSHPPRKLLKSFADWIAPLPKPVGIMTFESNAAAFLYHLCTLNRLNVPDDVLIIGVDDEDECLTCPCHLSSFSLPSETIGKHAVTTLLAHLKAPSRPLPRTIPIKGTALIIRGSTGPARTNLRDVSTALDIIKKDATKVCTADELHKLSSRASRSTFYKQFASATGGTPAKLLRESRLNEARRLLLETRKSIEEVSEACGFSSANYFNQVFSREMKMSPRAFRNSQPRTTTPSLPHLATRLEKV